MILRRYHIKDLFGTLNCMNREKGTFADTCAVDDRCWLAVYVLVSYGRIPVYKDRIRSVPAISYGGIFHVDLYPNKNCIEDMTTTLLHVDDTTTSTCTVLL